MAKMRAMQAARAGGPLELVEREMPEPRGARSASASRPAVCATATVSPSKGSGPTSPSRGSLGTRSPAPGRNGERDFHGEKRSNETHASVTDPDARLYRKAPGQPAKLAYLGHVLMENRHA